jgi:hypothetical protein
VWRRGWDSNPRCGFPHDGFQDRCLKPLGHPSSVPALRKNDRKCKQKPDWGPATILSFNRHNVLIQSQRMPVIQCSAARGLAALR